MLSRRSWVGRRSFPAGAPCRLQRMRRRRAPHARSGIDKHDGPPADLVFATNQAVLFQFSAPTYNAHRIPYDASYARRIEAYPAGGMGPAVNPHGAVMRPVAVRRPARSLTAVRMSRPSATAPLTMPCRSNSGAISR